MKRRSSGMTLCWDCANALYGCSWSRKFEPVRGWKVEERRIQYRGREDGIQSFRVIECPRFNPDARCGGMERIKKVNR